MRGGTLSFEVRTEQPDRVLKTALERWRRLGRPRAGILLVAGKLADHLAALASALADALAQETLPEGPVPVWLVAGGHGILTERGELERQSAAAGMVLEGVSPEALMSGPKLETFTERLGRALLNSPSASALTLVRADRFEEDMFEGLTESLRRELGRRVFGGGSIANHDVFLSTPGEVRRGPGASLLLRGLGPARILSAPGCRLIGPLKPVTRTQGSMLLEIGSERALDVLSAAGQHLADQPLLLLAVAGHTPPAPALDEAVPPAHRSSSVPPPSPPVLIRPIQGVDPSRGGVLLGNIVRPGTQVAFAVRDAAVARASLSEQLRQLSLSCAGSAPRFGIYINCAGRGAALYGAPDVDTKLVRARFEDVPLVGLQTAFELAPFDNAPALHLYTGVLALFCAPS